MVTPFHMSGAAHIQKIVALFCALMVIHVLGACGGGATSDPATTTAPTTSGGEVAATGAHPIRTTTPTI